MASARTTAMVAAVLGLAGSLLGCSSSSGQAAASSPVDIQLTSSTFTDGGDLPDANTCVHGGTRPPLSWTGVPTGAGSLAVVMVDTSVPGTFTHWYVVNLPASTTSLTSTEDAPGSHTVVRWQPPCPPAGLRDVYEFTVYALPKGYEPAKLGAAYAVDVAGLAAHAVGIGRISGVGTRPLDS